MRGASRHGDGAADEPLSFLEHLTDLRRCLIRCCASWFVATLVPIPFVPWIVRKLIEPLAAAGRDPGELATQRLDGGFAILVQIMVWGGLLLSLPLLLFFIAQFVFPGLTARERRAVRYSLLAAGILFMGGGAFCYEWIMPKAVAALYAVNDWMNVRVWPLNFEDFVGTVSKTVLAFGLAFELPLVLLALGAMGILPAAALRSRRRHAIVAIFIIAMVLTPPDVISQVAMALPMCLLYEVCILLIAMVERARGRRTT